MKSSRSKRGRNRKRRLAKRLAIRRRLAMIKRLPMRSIIEKSSDHSTTTMNDLNNDCLRHIFLRLPFIDRVRYVRVCKRWKSILGNSWPNVKKLELHKSNWYVKNGWKVTFETSLEYIPFSENIALGVSPENVKKILLLCGPYVEFLGLESTASFSLDDISVKFIKNSCKNLKTLCVRTASSFAYYELGALVASFPQLECIEMVLDSDLFLQYLPRQSMKEITLCGGYKEINIPEYSAKTIRNLPHLQRLNLYCYSTFSPGTLEIITKNNQTLKEIDLNLANLETSILPITNLSNLERLALTGRANIDADFLEKLAINCQKLKCISLVDIDSRFPAVMMTELGKLQALEDLEMQELSGAEFSDMSMMTTLKSFAVSLCPGIRNEALISLLHNAGCLEFLLIGKDSDVCPKKLYEVADLVTRKRLNGVVLKMDMSEVDCRTAYEDTPFLKMDGLGFLTERTVARKKINIATRAFSMIELDSTLLSYLVTRRYCI